MEIPTKKAVDLFENKYNCAQSVLTAFGPQFELEPEITLKIACGFGAGMGRLQETCGAVTGAFMVIGLKKNWSRATRRNSRSCVTPSLLRQGQELLT